MLGSVKRVPAAWWGRCAWPCWRSFPCRSRHRSPRSFVLGVPAGEVSKWFPAGTELRVMPAAELDALVARAVKGRARAAGTRSAEPDPGAPPRAVDRRGLAWS